MKELSFIIDNIFTYIENLAHFAGRQITLQKNITIESIGEILKNVDVQTEQSKKYFANGDLFDFVTPDGRVVADSIFGALKEQLVVSPQQRSWMILAPREPWKIHICKVDEGISINNTLTIPSLPFGYGITDTDGKFLGTLSGGIIIDKLKEKLGETIQSDNYSFIVLDSNLNYILYSEEEEKIIQKDKEILKKKLKYLEEKKNNFGTLHETILLDDVEYMFYSRAQNYPFIVIVGIKKHKIFDSKSLENKILDLQKHGQYDQMFLLSLLYLFQKKIINPVVNDNFKEENKNDSFKIPKVFSTQMNDLFLALEQMENFMDIKIQKEKSEEVAEERKELLEQRESFFQGIVHDLKNPISGLKGFLNIVEMQSYTATEEQIGLMKQACDNAMSLVDNILIVAKMQSGHLELHRSLFNLEALIDDVIRANRFNAEGKKIYLVKNIHKNIGEDKLFYGDKQVINRVLTNLVTNSVKFTQEGGITISLYKDEHNKIVISIKDTGHGIKKKDIREVVKNFKQAETDQKQAGTGIGLPIVKKFVEMHGGKLKIESEFGKGTEVKVILTPNQHNILT
jgi:signal transduction histidine kinase